MRWDRDMGKNLISDAQGNRSARRKPVRLGMDRQPDSRTKVPIEGIEPGADFTNV